MSALQVGGRLLLCLLAAAVLWVGGALALAASILLIGEALQFLLAI